MSYKPGYYITGTTGKTGNCCKFVCLIRLNQGCISVVQQCVVQINLYVPSCPLSGDRRKEREGGIGDDAWDVRREQVKKTFPDNTKKLTYWVAWTLSCENVIKLSIHCYHDKNYQIGIIFLQGFCFLKEILKRVSCYDHFNQDKVQSIGLTFTSFGVTSSQQGITEGDGAGGEVRISVCSTYERRES